MLKEEQKNYIDLVLIGGDMTNAELKNYLSLSGWNTQDIESGIKYSNTKVQKNDTNTGPTVSVNDPYKESPVLNMPVQDNFSLETKTDEQISSSNIKTSINQNTTVTSILSKSVQKNGLDGISQIVTMPTNIPKGKNTSKVLKVFAWLLFFVFILILGGLVSYMYITKTGIFSGIVYIKTIN